MRVDERNRTWRRAGETTDYEMKVIYIKKSQTLSFVHFGGTPELKIAKFMARAGRSIPRAAFQEKGTRLLELKHMTPVSTVQYGTMD